MYLKYQKEEYQLLGMCFFWVSLYTLYYLIVISDVLRRKQYFNAIIL